MCVLNYSSVQTLTMGTVECSSPDLSGGLNLLVESQGLKRHPVCGAVHMSWDLDFCKLPWTTPTYDKLVCSLSTSWRARIPKIGVGLLHYL